MRVDFRKDKKCSRAEAEVRNFKRRLFSRKRSCGNSSHSILCETAELQVTDCSVCDSRTAELRDIVYSLCGSELQNFKSQNILCAEAEQRDLKSKLLYGSGTAKLPSHSSFLVRKRNCAISEHQVTHYSVCGSGTAEL